MANWWTNQRMKSKNQWNKTFGKGSSFDNNIKGITTMAGAAGTMLNNGFSLATPQNKGLYDSLRGQIKSINSTPITATDFDTINQIQNSYTPLRTNYKWSDFYALGGQMPNRYSAGGRMATGIIGSTGTGAAAGAQVGGLWGGIIGGALGLGSSLFGAFNGHNKAKRMANRINDWSENANEGMDYKIRNAVDNTKQFNALSYSLRNPYAYGGLLDSMTDGSTGAIDYGFMTDYLTMKNNQAKVKDTGLSKLGNSFGTDYSLNGNIFANGGKIHINPRKRAQFAINARKWNHKHDEGGPLENMANNVNRLLSSGTIGRENYNEKLQMLPELLNSYYPYHGGEGGGGGAGTFISSPGASSYIVPDTLWMPVQETFNDAFKAARKAKKKTFEFNGKIYNTELGDNPKNYEAGQKRTREALIPVPWEHRVITPAPPVATPARDADNNLLYPRAYGGSLNDTLFALGGDLQTNGSDWSTGLTHVDAGQSHEQNPYEGVQMGIASDGEPNLVEENETIDRNNDFVYSERLKADKTAVGQLGLGKRFIGKSFADISKYYEKESKERPNDPISRNALQKQLDKLAEVQEDQKSREEAEQARKEFEALSPEEQQMVIQQMQQQQQDQLAAQQQAQIQQEQMQGAPMDEQQMAQQEAPQQMTDQQMMQQQLAQEGMDQQALTGALGGKLGHKFKPGGPIDIKSAIINALAENGDWDKYAAASGIEGFAYADPWEYQKILDSEALMNALKLKNPRLADAIAAGYGSPYEEKQDRLFTDDQQHGNWNQTDLQYWRNSNDPAIKELIQSGFDFDKSTQDDFIKALQNTKAYKATTKWLHNQDNALRYFNGILNDPNSPQSAKYWASKFVNSKGQWKNTFGQSFDYNTMIKPKREDLYPGSYWKSVLPAQAINDITNLLQNDDGTITPITDTSIIKDLDFIDNYDYQDNNGTHRRAYYQKRIKRNNVTMPGSLTGNSLDKLKDIAEQPIGNGQDELNGQGEAQETVADSESTPYLKALPTGLQYMSAVGPGIATLMQLSGIGRPSRNAYSSALSTLNNAAMADYKPIGNYLTYRPMDIWAEQNRLDANNRAAARSLVNNNAPVGAKAATLLANNYNYQLGLGELAAKARQYNDSQRQAVAEFNKDTDKTNASAYNSVSQYNAGQRNNLNNERADLAYKIAAANEDSRASWYNSLYGNIGNIFNNFGAIGTGNRDANMIRAKWNASGLPITEDINAMTGNGGIGYRAKGGKINRKKNKRKGLTY